MAEERPVPTGDRTTESRDADHASIERLADSVLPALIAKLTASGLGEIEVREGSWKVRIRRPRTEGADQGRRSTDRPSRSQPGHAGHGHPPAGFEGHRSAREGRAVIHSGNGSGPPAAAPGAPTSEGTDRSAWPDIQRGRVVATSPAVGVYQPRADATPGTRVRAGDRLGDVDMLGIPQEVVAPDDGLIGASLVEPGQAVEYGQELVIIDLVQPPAGEG